MGRMKDRMLRGELYNGATAHAEQAVRDAILAELLGSMGDGVVIRPRRAGSGGSRASRSSSATTSGSAAARSSARA
jgi:hypothetical protein